MWVCVCVLRVVRAHVIILATWGVLAPRTHPTNLSVHPVDRCSHVRVHKGIHWWRWGWMNGQRIHRAFDSLYSLALTFFVNADLRFVRLIVCLLAGTKVALCGKLIFVCVVVVWLHFVLFLIIILSSNQHARERGKRQKQENFIFQLERGKILLWDKFSPRWLRRDLFEKYRGRGGFTLH